MDPSKLTPEQLQVFMAQAQQEANQQIMQSMVEKMVSACFKKCAGTSVRLRYFIGSLLLSFVFLSCDFFP